MIVTHWLQSLCARLGWREVRRKSSRKRPRVYRTLVLQGLETREVLSAVPDTLVITVPDVAVEAYVLANDDDSGGPLEIVSVTQPDQGSVSIIDGDSDHLLYTPAAGFSGSESLTYTVEDSAGNEHTASVTITVGGSSAVPGGDPGLPGSVSYALQAGFNVDPAASFVATASGNYSLQDVRSTTTTDTRLDNQGVTHTDVTTQSATLTIASTQAADGSWTYSETLASATGIATTGSDGSTASAAGSYNYSFTASGDDTGSTYTFNASGTEGVTTTYTEAWSTSDAGGTSTFTTTEISQFLVTVGNTTNADGTGSGSSSGIGSINRTYTGAGTYWYNFSTGSVSGVTIFGGFKNYSYSYATAAILDSSGWSTTGSRSDLESGSDTTSYLGSGTYSYVANGGTVSGAVTESGSDSGTALYATSATLAADGTWIESATGSNSGSSTDNWSYAGAGTYSYQASGGTVSGALVESGYDNHWSMHTTISTLPAGGVWSSSGSGSGGGSTADNWSYLGTGNYVSQSPGGTVTGTVFEDGHDNSAWTYATISTLVADGVWITSGAGGGGGSTADNWSYIGSGGYSYEANGGAVSGTITESGHDDSASSYTTLSTMVAGVWISTGTDSESGNSADNWSYVGTGSYSYDTDGGTVSGTVSEDGFDNSTSSFSTISTLAASGIWTTTGSGSGGGSSADNLSYVGSGSYSHEGNGGTVSGTIAEDGHDDSFSTYTTTSTLPAGGVWTMTGTGSGGGGDSADNWSYIGSGSYSYEANGGTISGTIDEDGHDDSFSNFATTSTLAADGTWTTTSGTGGGGGSRADNWSYDGSGAYSYDTDGGTISGTINEDGHDDSSSSSTTTSIMVAGIWITTGTGSENGDTVDNWSYIGSGSYSYESDNGTVSGTITEDGHDDSSASYSTNSVLAANGVWTTTGTGSRTSDSADNWSYNGSGSYSYEGVSGTITEDGYDDSWSSSSTSSVLAANGIWTTTGTGGNGGDTADNWSYAGSGFYSYDANNGTVSGTINEDGYDDTWSSFSTTSALANGVWTSTSGTDGEGGASASNWSYEGSGSYSSENIGGTVSGTINEDGHDDTSSSYSTTSTLAGGVWTTTGTAMTSGDIADNWSYDGTGTYAYDTIGGTVSGTIAEDGHNDTSSSYTTNATLAGGIWTNTGTDTTTSDSADNWSYTGSGSYSYDDNGGTVSGTINEDGYDDSFYSSSTTSTLAADGTWTSTGTGGGGGSSANNWSYEGSGSYSYDTIDSSVSGTIEEDGYDNSSSSYSTTSTLPAGGSWTETGSSSGSSDWAANWSYEGSGAYSYDAGGGTVSGTIEEDGYDNSSGSSSTNSTLANGIWTTTGSSSDSGEIASNWSYEGSGSYSYDTTGGSVSGTINEDGDDNDSSTFSTTSTLSANGVWTTTGTGTNDGDDSSNWSYTGNGTYSYDTPGGSVSGTITEDGHDDSSSSYSTTSTLADGVWTDTGSGSSDGDIAHNWSYSGSGSYSYETTGGTVSGTIDEDGHDDSSSSYSTTSNLANGVWTSTGTANADGDIADNWSYEGSGSYSYDTLGGSVSGTITEDGHDDSSSSYSTTSTLADGVWTSTGTGADDVDAANNFSYTGSGSYSYDTNGGTVSGTITEDGFDDDSYILSTTSTLADGVWTDTGSSSETRDTANNWSYTGSGSYSYDTTGGTVSGSITEDGQDNDSSSYATTSTLADGAWTTTGTSTEDGDSESNWSYNGSGSYSYDTTGGSVSGSITEDGEDNASASYSWTSTLADGVWTTTGSQTEGGDSSSNWSYNGSGTYSATDGATYAVSGSITESGHDNAASSHSTTSTLDADGDWTSTGNASDSGDRAHDWSFSGSGTVSTSTSETSGDASNGSSSSSSFNSSVNESGEEHDSDVFSTTSTMVNGVWTTTGGGTRTSDGQRTSTYSVNGSSSSSSNSSSSYSDENGSSSSSSSYSSNSSFSHTSNNNSSHQFSDVWAYAPDGAITSTTTQSNDTDSSVTYSHSAGATSSSSYSSSGGGSSSSGSSYDTWSESYSGGYDDQTSSNSTTIVGASSSAGSSSSSSHDRQSYGNATYHHSGNWSNSYSSSSPDSSYSSSNSGNYSTDTTDNFDYTGSWSWSVAADGTQTESSSSVNNVDGTLDEISHSEWAWSSTSPEGSDGDSGSTDYENHESYAEVVDYEGFYSGAYHAYGYYYGYGYGYYYGYGYGYYGGTVSDAGGPARGGPGGHYVGSSPGAPWHGGGPAKAGAPATFPASTDPNSTAPASTSGSSSPGTASGLIAASDDAPSAPQDGEGISPAGFQSAMAAASTANAVASLRPSSFGGGLKRMKQAVDDLIAGGKKLDPKVLELGLDLAQLGIDIIGIFEPTPFADGINTAISLFRRDWWGAGLSAVGMVPYIGDVAKLGKLGKYAKSVATAIELAKKSPEVAKVLQPVMESLSRILNSVGDKVPALAAMRKQIDEFLGVKSNTVYTSTNKATGKVQYVGITNDLARRAAEHLAKKGIKIEKLLDGLSRYDAHAVEQALIEIHRSGGKLKNKINSVAKDNPKYAEQLKRGLELLESVGY